MRVVVVSFGDTRCVQRAGRRGRRLGSEIANREPELVNREPEIVNRGPEVVNRRRESAILRVEIAIFAAKLGISQPEIANREGHFGGFARRVSNAEARYFSRSRRKATVRGQACWVALRLAPLRSSCARRNPWPAPSKTWGS